MTTPDQSQPPTVDEVVSLISRAATYGLTQAIKAAAAAVESPPVVNNNYAAAAAPSSAIDWRAAYHSRSALVRACLILEADVEKRQLIRDSSVNDELIFIRLGDVRGIIEALKTLT